jgi:hypothetical protein
VEPNGTVTAAALATEDMLGRASRPQVNTQRLNVFVLTEMTLEYFRLVDTHIVPRAPGSWRHRIRAQRFQEPTTITLGSGGGSPRFPSYGEVRRASAQDWDRSWTAVGDPERDTYEALRHIYRFSGCRPPPTRSSKGIESTRRLCSRHSARDALIGSPKRRPFAGGSG